jgi:tight adherence protein B
MTDPVLFAAVALVAIFAIAWVSATIVERRRRLLQGRLAAVVVVPSDRPTGFDPSASLRRQTARDRAPGLALLPTRLHRWMLNELHATGGLTFARLAIVAVTGAVLTAGALTAILGFALFSAITLAFGAGIAIAAAWLRLAQRRFQRRFIDVFPDALDVIVRAARAGLSVFAAIEAAVETIAEPVSDEFRKVLDEIQIGVGLEEALEDAANRIRVNDFRFFAAAIVLQQRTGGSLAETLSNLSGLIRKRKEIRLKVRALSAETRATAYLLGALPVIMVGVIYLINPDLMTLLFTDPRGQVVLAIAIVMEVTGFLLMTTMIKRALR